MRHIRERKVSGFIAGVLCLICTVCCLLGSGLCLKAEAVDISVTNMEYSDNGGETTLTRLEDSTLSVTYDTEGEEEGYYTVFLYSEQNVTLSEGNVISFHMEAETAVKMNLNTLPAAGGEAHQIEEDSCIFIKREDSSKYEVLSVEYGTFEVPAEFEGTIYLPVSLEDEQVNGIGFIVVQSEEQTSSFTMSSLKVTSGQELEDDVFNSQFEIDGETSIEIPMKGEYYYDYSVNLLDSPQNGGIDSKFYLESEAEGITMEEDGRLWVTDEAASGSVSVLVEMNGLLEYRFEIELDQSWLGKVEDVDVSDFIVPDVEDVEEVSVRLQIPYTVIRILCVGVVSAFFVFYKKKISKRGQ